MTEVWARLPVDRYRLAAGSLFVIASMAVMFELPPQYFITAAFASTTCMVAVSLWMRGYRELVRPSSRSIVLGLASAVALYLTFVVGNLAISAVHPFGIGPNNASSIYSLIASTSNPLYVQLLVLLFDAVGYESFFRGILQRRARRLAGGAAPLAVALADSAIHVLTLNPLWVVTTFIVDATWGYTYLYAKDLTSSMTSHFVWDLLIFVIIPVR